MVRPRRPIDEYRQQMKKDALELMTCIYACSCKYCGAQPGQHCVAKMTKRSFSLQGVSTQSLTPHMDRVRSGHVVRDQNRAKGNDNNIIVRE